ncbi:MAG: thiamine diphosphokinase [Clostridia bacterium]
MKVLILTGGRLNDSGNLREKVQRYNPKWVIAADSGLVHAQRFGLIPNEILGDFDSVDSALVKQYQNFQGEITQYPPRKDYTDTELAIEAAMEKAGHTGEIWILGGTGSRIDHSLANVTLLKQPTDAGVRCRLLDGQYGSDGQSAGGVGRGKEEGMRYISLIPMFGDVAGVTLEGFLYPLQDALLPSGRSLGISNELLYHRGRIRIISGYLLIIQSSD